MSTTIDPDAGSDEGTELKTKLETVWTTGDYGWVARGMQDSAEAFMAEHLPAPGERVLDIACGTGQLAIPCARAGAEVTGLDLSEAWLAQARERAAAEGLDIRLDQGDAEAMPYPDASFDMVVSLIGVMFAPRPERAAAEMLRVCRPGGRILMGNWTPEGRVGEFFRIIAGHVPPPDMPSPLLWGTEDAVRERLGDAVTDLTFTRRMMHFSYPLPPEAVADHYLEHFGPVKTAAAQLDADARAALRDDIVAHWAAGNTATDGTTEADAEFLVVRAVKR